MNDADLKIETVNPQPTGGQTVGIVNAAVCVTHIPTGLSATCGYERSQSKNKQIAISMLEWGLAELRG